MKKEIWDAVAGIDERYILEAAEVQRQPGTNKSAPEFKSEKLRVTTRRWSWGKVAVIILCLGFSAAGAALLLRLAPWSTGAQTPGESHTAVSSPLPETPSGNAEATAPAPETTEHINSGLDEEIQAAIDAHENKLFWRVAESGAFPEKVSTWTWTALDAQAFWPELRERLFGADLNYTPGRRGDVDICSFKLDGEVVEVRIFPYGEISFFCKSPKRAEKIAELLTETEAERLGLSFEERPEDHTTSDRLVRTPQLDGLPLDTHCRTAFAMGHGGISRIVSRAELHLPMDELRSSGSLSSDSLLTPEDVEETLLYLNVLPNARPAKSVEVCQSCQPVYYADLVSGMIRPAWRVDGIQYLYWDRHGKYETHRLVLIVDAQSGEVFTAEGQEN